MNWLLYQNKLEEMNKSYPIQIQTNSKYLDEEIHLAHKLVGFKHKEAFLSDSAAVGLRVHMFESEYLQQREKPKIFNKLLIWNINLMNFYLFVVMNSVFDWFFANQSIVSVP